jgi:DNA-binding GntR family transcriptional regulator
MDSFKSLKDHVYQYISGKINDGSLLPETKISEKMVVDDMNISRTPVREALIQLATEGYLENIPRKGFIVKRVDKKKAQEVYSLLGVLEGFAASLSVERFTQEDIDHLLQYYEQMETAIETGDIKAYYNYQNRFHDIYIQKSENQELIKVIQLLKKIFIRQTYTMEKEGDGLKMALKTTNQEHKVIIELFEEKNGAGLEDFLKCHHWKPELAFYDTF